ncbi:MAG TPA: cytochrome b/b6 domain-containing protein [Actinomycetota bacterium]|jgi:formate dehydrogenase subunit gamma|nr:cytochrome b/b6 domain-containing protein [Actinomycetota bacterium]
MAGTIPAAATETTAAGKRLLRNRPAARRLHAGLYLLTGFLLLSGLAVLGDGNRALEALLGGHVATARWHRWVGFCLLGLGILVAVFRRRASSWFLAQSVRFRRQDLGWFARYPGFLLRPSRHAPAPHDGHFDPGQRAFNLVVVVSLVILAATGAVMSFPDRFIPAAFAASLRIHGAATWVLAVAVAGHLLVTSGVLRGYRGVWRAMHRDGRVTAGLAELLWPKWAREERDRPA